MRTPREQQLSEKQITRRAVTLGGLQVLFIGGLAGRMYHLQVQQEDQFRLLAEENRIDVRLIAPNRGLVYDRYGRLIAGNVQNFGVTITREEAQDTEEVLRRLGAIIPITPAQLDATRKALKARASFAPVLVRDGLTWDQISQISVNAPALPGVTPEVGQIRIYPLGQDFAHTVGYVGRVTERDLERVEDQDPVLRLPQFKIGKIGVERALDQSLRGRAGTRKVEVNAAGRVMRELESKGSSSGRTLRLTLDAALQNYTTERLGEESSAAVIMDIETGDILAAASAPTYDPNLFVGGISQTDYDALLNNTHRPLHNKIVSGLYPPGSTFKMITALAGLEAGLITPDERINCAGSLEVSDRKFHCWRRGGHGRMNARDSLVQSCDVYYYDLCQRAGIEGIAAMARKLGLGQRYDVSMTSVSEGLVPSRDWKFRTHKQDWRIGDTLNASIGQGYVLASPLQLAVMTSRLASGKSVMPKLLRSVDGRVQDGGAAPDLGLTPENLRLVREAMFGVMNDGKGTAFASRILTDGQKWAGKTGTSQVRNITAAERARGVVRNEDLPWERRDHALFVGFAPFDAPRYAVSVVVEHGGGGSTAAAPIARDLMLFALNNGLPPLSAYPGNQRRDVEDAQDALTLRNFPEIRANSTRA